MNYLLTGLPKAGKTTLLKKVVGKLKTKAVGFYTEEMKKDNIRVGFMIVTLSGRRGILSHKDFKSRFRVGKYGVDINSFDGIAVKEIEEALGQEKIVVIDEIGKMELFSKRFQDIVLKALDSKSPVLGTIMAVKHPFADRVKKRADVKVFEVTKEKREKLVDLLLEELES